jgi:hypothetical protein
MFFKDVLNLVLFRHFLNYSSKLWEQVIILTIPYRFTKILAPFNTVSWKKSLFLGWRPKRYNDTRICSDLCGRSPD